MSTPTQKQSQALLGAIRVMAEALDSAPVDVLEVTRDQIYDYYMQVLDETHRDLANAAKQRVLGALWAEFEMAVDERHAGISVPSIRSELKQ